ncbi:methyltransferase domain-containing protein [Advenella sp. WQ 585]|uniref:Methyltransferase domain-containing protein n=1 Tax=Advenella mandrilli TaxID=2800330 RepID=A0ABS1ECZ3_9BURK|nr:class I SAM-dependent methyltransferase [Advenella mandrilli]MBK1780758.1 methyltransferase domain-containing protein [Advenella mandrilli]
MTQLVPVLSFAHQLLRQAVQPGDVAVDATMGNGHDTLVLAQCVGENGKVYAFDVQEQALQKTRRRLQAAGLDDQVELICQGHQYMNEHVRQALSAVIFNLGYLPGGNKALTTQRDTTLAAITQGLGLLKPHGLLLLVIYPGHEAGRIEQEAIEALLSGLDQQYFRVLRYQLTNQGSSPPYLLAIEKQFLV